MREEGNSLRWTRVTWRCDGMGAASDFEEDSGVREMDQASPLRKRTLDAAATEVFVEVVSKLVELEAV